MLNITTISGKGQIVIPKAIRDFLNISPSDTFTVEIKGKSIVVRRLNSLKGVYGMFKAKKPITKKDIKKSYKKGVSKKHALNT
jgi:AbrB family looped-hinge helix DNA binding protein